MTNEELIKHYLTKVLDHLDCGDSSCYFRKPKTLGGQHTNGGCRCLRDIHPESLRLALGGLLMTLKKNEVLGCQSKT